MLKLIVGRVQHEMQEVRYLAGYTANTKKIFIYAILQTPNNL